VRFRGPGSGTSIALDVVVRCGVVVVSCLVACGSSSPAAIDGSTPATPVEISASSTDAFEFEPAIADDGSGHLVASWNGAVAGESQVGYASSNDGGKTWSAPGRIALAAPDTVVDSSVVFDGAVFLLSVLEGNPNGGLSVVVAPIEPATNTVGSGATAGGPGQLDHPAMAVTSDGIVVAWQDLNASVNATARTVDHGGSFSAVATTGAFAAPVEPALGTMCGDGSHVYVAYLGLNAQTGTGGARIDGAADGGTTWTVEQTVVAPAMAPVSPECAASGSDVWVAYPAGTGVFAETTLGVGSAVEVAHSSDGGRTFAAPVLASGGADSYLIPTIAREAGALAVIYYEGTMAGPASIVVATSRDDGATFERTTIAHPGTFTASRTGTDFVGDYMNAVFADGHLSVVYADNTGGTAHIFYEQVSL
jgi:prepilin-type processing-associated H-X9-DG protein